MQLMWEGLPGNTTARTESFIVMKNGHIHHTAHFFAGANAWQHHLQTLDTTVLTSYTPVLMMTHVNLGCVRACTGQTVLGERWVLQDSPGGVHASTED